jgi:hypothetical protein
MEPQTARHAFSQFLAKFPPVDMPVTLGEDTHHVFLTENEPLTEEMIRQFILPAEPAGTELDEFTEFAPCFAIANTDSFFALVWWKAELLTYHYMLATFTNNGQLIDRRVIAHTVATEDQVDRRVATINEEWEIFIAEGSTSDGMTGFDPGSSRTFIFEIMANGEIAI